MITSFKTEQLGIGFDFDIQLEPDKAIYCFIGKNGVGKTQLLENMAKALIFIHSMYFIVDGTGRSHIFRKTIDELNNHALKFPLNTQVNGIYVSPDNSLDDLIKLNGDRLVCRKPIVFVGAKNRGFTKNIDSKNIKILSDSLTRFTDSLKRTLNYINGEGLEQQEIADWFTSRLIINPNFVTDSQNKTHEAETVLQLIDRLEPNLNLVTKNAQGESELKIKFSEGQLFINDIPLDKLSTGYVSIVKIFQEIVAGYSGWTNEERLNEVECIVFIDELEPHLHISWQTKIINILREFFPKTTFFISTHSPLVLAGLKNGEGYELVRDGNIVKSKTIDNIENYFLNDIVKEFFDVDLNQEKINHVDKEKQAKAKKLLLNLVTQLQEDE